MPLTKEEHSEIILMASALKSFEGTQSKCNQIHNIRFVNIYLTSVYVNNI